MIWVVRRQAVVKNALVNLLYSLEFDSHSLFKNRDRLEHYTSSSKTTDDWQKRTTSVWDTWGR